MTSSRSPSAPYRKIRWLSMSTRLSAGCGLAPPYESPLPIHAGPQFARIGLSSRAPGEHHDIETGQRALVRPKAFADDALEPVAIHRAAQVPARGRQPEPGVVTAVGASEDRYVPIARAHGLRKDPPEFRRRAEPLATSEASQAAACASRPDYGVSRCRPLARRARMTARPLAVAMRARNPWVRLRRSTLG